MIIRTVRELHEKAMESYDLAVQARRIGNRDSEVKHLSKAFEDEKQAADQMLLRLNIEPTRSVIYRSAATIALQLGNYDEARDLAIQGLSGYPPTDILKELTNILKEIRTKGRKNRCQKP